MMETAMATTAKFSKYPVYKDSGVEWLGEIPEGWEVGKIKYLFKEINERSFDGAEDLLSVSQYTGVTRKTDKVDEGDLLTTASTLEGYKKVYQGDLVSNIMLAWNGSLGFSPFDGITSPAYSVYRMVTGHENRYFHYLLRTELYKSEFKRNSSGVIESRLRLYTDDFFSIISIIPPLTEQRAIASFLDEKTTKIDRAIAQKEKLIALLKERKQIIIQNAVTKGLDPAAKMKDSGVDWIGEIPEGWEVKKLKYLGNSIIGLTYSPDDLCNENEGTLVLRSSNLFEGKFKYGEKENVYVKTKIPNKLRLKEKDILICSRNGSRDLIGKCAFATNIDAGASFGAFTTVFRSPINDYVFNILNSEIFKHLSGMFLTSTINQLTIGNLNSIEIPLPPFLGRVRIMQYIETQSQKIDASIALQEKQIVKLKEYKAVLIDGAVTGKIKVTNV
jgi:type I restriction enzyme S subunit